MLTAQNTQLHSHPIGAYGSKLIKFCYILLPLLLLSCGDGNSEKKTSETSEIEQSTNESSTEKKKTILCFGDSITAGYGLEDSNEAYPAILQEKIDEADLDYTVVNSGVSGETTAGGKSRVEWVIKQPADIFLLELGANDGLRGIALTETRANLQSIIDIVKEKSPTTTIVLAGMELPPNMGRAYTTEFKQLYADLAEKNNLEFIPFILKDVGGNPELNQGDGIHPNVEGHKILATTVWGTLEPLLTH